MFVLLALACAVGSGPVTKTRLDNGLEVILAPDSRLPLVSVSVVYHSGSASEPATRTGLAHLFEHLMFQGSSHVPDEAHFRLLAEAGSSDTNGETDFDLTHYDETVPSEALELALWLESDRMGFLSLSQTTLDIQREVVRNERRENFDETPYGRVEEGVLSALFPASHPYSRGVIGSMAHLQEATLDDARRFFASHYSAQNATLALVGDFEPRAAMGLVTKYFGSLPMRAAIPRAPLAMPDNAVKPRLVVDDPLATVPRLTVAFVTAPFAHEDDVAMQAWAELLGGGSASRLYRSLVEGVGLAESVSADVDALAGGSVFEITVAPLLSTKIEALEKKTLAALERALTAPVSVEELERIIARQETAHLLAQESPSGLASVLQAYNHYTGDPLAYRKELERFRALTPARLRAAAERWLTHKRRCLVITRPSNSLRGRATKASQARKDTKPAADPLEQAARVTAGALADKDAGQEMAGARGDLTGISRRRSADADAFRAAVPSPEENLKPQLPTFVTGRTRGGIPVFVSRDTSLPLVAMSLGVLVGAADDPDGQDGLAEAAFAWMEEGTSGGDAGDLDARFGRLGASLDVSVGRDTSVLSTTVAKDRAGAALSALVDTLAHPTFDVGAFTSVKERMRAARIALEGDPVALGVEGLERVIWEPRFSHPASGSTETIERLDAKSARTFHETRVLHSKVSVVFVGDITLGDALALTEERTGSFNPVPVAEPAPAPSSSSARVSMYEKNNIGTTFLGLVAKTVQVGHEDEAALRLATEIFAGLFHSRLNTRLREQLGITYGVNGVHATMARTGAAFALSQVRADATETGLREALAIIDGLNGSPLSETELKSAKDSVLRAMPGRFVQREATASAFSSLAVLGAPGDVFTQRAQRIRDVDLARLRRVVAQYLSPSFWRIVLVTDPKVGGAALKRVFPTVAPAKL
jgi:zinc protease